MFRQIIRFFDKCAKDQIAAYSGYAAFFTILSAFPFLMLLLALLKYTPITEDYLISSLTSIVPAAFHDIVRLLITDLTRVDRVNTIISLTAIITLWSASKGLVGLMTGLNSVYHAEDRHYILQRITAAFYTISFIILIVLMLGLMVFGNQIHIFLTDHYPLLEKFSGFIINIRSYLLVGIMTLFFMLVYQVFPNRKARYLVQFPGAAVAAIGWTLLSFGFSLYVDYFSNASKMYGSLTTILLLMLWLYTCMYLLLLGAEFNSVVEERRNIRNQLR